MKTIETTATVTPEGMLTIQLPPEIQPGEYEMVIVIDERAINKENASGDTTRSAS
jgi:hypothetical protein